jgi:predicted transcriptional regulator
MSTVTIRIADETHATLRQLAREQGRTIAQVANEAIDQYAREQFLAGLNEDYARLQADPAAWADWQAELKSLEGTLMDGLEDDPWTE